MAALPAPLAAAPTRVHRCANLREDLHDAVADAPRNPSRRRGHDPFLGAAAPGRTTGLHRGAPDAVGPARVQGARPAALAPGPTARAGGHHPDDAARGRNGVRFAARLRPGRRPPRHRLEGLGARARTHGAPVASRTRPPRRHRRGLRACRVGAAGRPRAHGGGFHRPGLRAAPGLLYRDGVPPRCARRPRGRQGPRPGSGLTRSCPRFRRARPEDHRDARSHLHGHLRAPGRDQLVAGRGHRRADGAPSGLRRYRHEDPARGHGDRVHGCPVAPDRAPHGARGLGDGPGRAARAPRPRGRRGGLFGGLRSPLPARGRGRGGRRASRRRPHARGLRRPAARPHG